MKTSLKPITKTQRRRFEIMANEIGCIACHTIPAEIHHLLSGGNRISHDHTIPLCPACHTGEFSTHRKKWTFAAMHGSDTFLLQLTNIQVAGFESRTTGAAA